MPRNRFSPEALEPFIEEALAAEAVDPMGVSFEDQPSERKPTFRKYGLPALVLSAGADILSTDHALRSGNALEGNPVYGRMGRGGIALTNAAVSAAMALLMDHAAKRSPRADKVATIGSLIAGGVRGGIAANNMRIAKGAR